MYIFLYVAFAFGDLVTQKLDQLPSYDHKWFSGYLNKGEIFYTLFESQNQPMNDPLFLWMQGGPGCSSLFGLFYEIGPFRFDPLKNSTYLNPNAWNKKSNLLFLELPQGVGFSNPEKYSNDTSAAEDALKALQDFFVQFKNYSNHAFYIGGESYAGMYIPYLTKLILQDKNINLKGFMIGNGCTLGSECSDIKLQPLYVSQFQFEMYFNRAFFSFEDMSLFKQQCSLNFSSNECVSLQYKLLNKIDYTQVDIDNILGYCYHNSPDIQQANGGRLRNPHNHFSKKLHFKQQYQTCNYDYGEYFFFNNQTVQKAIHANQLHWSSCSSTLQFKEDPKGSFDLYAQFLKTDLKMWIYSGDVDSNVPITGTLKWIQMLGLKESEKWRPWFVEGIRPNETQVGGMTWEFGNKIRFISVRGAGHEVPFWKPVESEVLFLNFIQGGVLK